MKKKKDKQPTKEEKLHAITEKMAGILSRADAVLDALKENPTVYIIDHHNITEHIVYNIGIGIRPLETRHAAGIGGYSTWKMGGKAAMRLFLTDGSEEVVDKWVDSSEVFFSRKAAVSEMARRCMEEVNRENKVLGGFKQQIKTLSNTRKE